MTDYLVCNNSVEELNEMIVKKVTGSDIIKEFEVTMVMFDNSKISQKITNPDKERVDDGV